MKTEEEIRKRKFCWERLLKNKKQLYECGDIKGSEFCEFKRFLKSLIIELDWVLEDKDEL